MYIITLRRALILLLTLGVAVAAIQAYAASNTVPTSKAGIGSGTISGYTISNVAYTLDGSDPTKIASVDFTLDSSASTVKAKLISSSTTYHNCSISGGVNVTCTFSPQPTVLAADELAVIAVQ
jgi:hypothetical protein